MKFSVELRASQEVDPAAFLNDRPATDSRF